MMLWPLPDDGPFSRRPLTPFTDDPDVHLAYAVVKRLADDPDLRLQRITVEVQNRVVLLSGTADAPHRRRAAADTARHVDGVLDVCNDIHVKGTDELATATASSGDRFDEIAALLSVDNPAGRRLRPLTMASVGVLAALLWASLLVLIVRHGGMGVAITCAVVAITITITSSRRDSRRHSAKRRSASEPPGPGR